MKVKRSVEKWVKVCDICKEKEAIGVCVKCGKDLCVNDALKIDVTPPASQEGFHIVTPFDHEYVFLCGTCQKTKMSLRQFLQQFGCSKGNIKHEHIRPL
jgi:hypothetical protein